jgi:acyl-coenzyme A thioesterase PaaI-like protein
MSEPHMSAHLDPLTHLPRIDEPDAHDRAFEQAGRAVRDIGHALMGHAADEALLTEVADTLDALTATLEQGVLRSSLMAGGPTEWVRAPEDGGEMFAHPDRPITGRSSPWGLDVRIVRDGQEAVGYLTLRAAHEGAPKRSHGGIVAALFDDLFGFVLTILRQPGFTGELSVRYERGTPIGVPLECRVRLDHIERRKLMMSGELTDAEGVIARSKATFIAIDPQRFRGADSSL